MNSGEKIIPNIHAKVIFEIADETWIDVHYELTPVNCKGYFTELGLSFQLAENINEFSWLGDGPYAAYPFKEELAIRGIYTLQNDDLYFKGNRQNVDMAMFLDENGNGLGLVTSKSNIHVENDTNGIVISHNLLVASPGTKFKMPRLTFPANEVGRQSGSIRLVPLKTNQWPSLFRKVFGK